MIGLPIGTQVWIATGVTDMRRGFDGLAASLKRIRLADMSLCSVAAKAIASKSCGGVVMGYAYSPNGWSTGTLCGRRPHQVRCIYPPHNSPCYSKALIGDVPSEHINPHRSKLQNG